MAEVGALLARLNLETRRAHAAVDGPWQELLSPSVSISEYLNQLVRTYGLVAPFESACKYTPGLSRLLDFGQLNRAGLIAQDLLALHLTPAQVATIRSCPTIQMFASSAEAFGWLYMIERTTLLAEGVRKHLATSLPQVNKACSYLTAFEGHVDNHWKSFGHKLDRVSSKDAKVADEVVDAAHQAFDTARSWFRVLHHDTRSVG